MEERVTKIEAKVVATQASAERVTKIEAKVVGGNAAKIRVTRIHAQLLFSTEAFPQRLRRVVAWMS